MTLCVVVGYTLAWLPLNLFLLYTELTRLWNPDPNFVPDIPNIEYIFFVVHWLAMAHTTYNPIIYAWINIKFRSTFYQVMRNCLPWKNKDKRRFGSSGLHYSGTQSRTLKSVIVTQRNKSCNSRPGGGGGVGAGASINMNLNGNSGRSLIANGTNNTPGIGNPCEKMASRSTRRLL